MHRIPHLFFTIMLILLSAGCISADSPKAEDTGIRLLTPADPFSIFDGQATCAEIIGKDSPGAPANYSLAIITIQAGNATPPHRLLGSTELLHVIGGEATIRCDNSTLTARMGETVILPEGALQSIAAAGDDDLRYIDVVQPPFTPAIEVPGDDLAATDGRPIVIPDPGQGIEWDYGTVMIYTLANPVLMPEMDLPIGYSLAYAELQTDGSVGYNRLNGSSEVIYVIHGEVEVFWPENGSILVPAGSAAYIPSDQVKNYRNAAESTSAILSFVDPAWTEEKTEMLE
ncbi:cupin domain-containing protein [Methanofollis fontis]|uniref:Cupin n=1 Tax=Methanofollis fontis TaxID=2052832 RepID=A0A483CXM4_9EURY|nr:cupin domain-containing protein [Methanofollis fontis]TAJ44073.1 cupin [Methanofollis fontis]